ncbi:WD40 repeat-like protein, partial [Metschnikowia bicuspidata var. bicuspidata NRRL YB-4993]
VSVVSFSVPADDTLLVAAYDRSVRLYNCKRRSTTASLAAPAPVLCVAYSPYRTSFAGLLDGTIRQLDYENLAVSAPVVSAAGRADEGSGTGNGINCFRPLDTSLFVATTFGGTMLRFDPRALRVAHTQQLRGKALAMDTCGHLVTVALLQQAVEIHDVRKWGAPVLTRASGLRFQALALRAFPSGEGYVLSSVDGRVSVEYYDDLAAAQTQKFAFKCHRVRAPAGGEDAVYPVTGLRFHPVHGTLFTAGGDGNVCVWNWEKRKRMKLLAHGLELPRAISHMDLSADGAYVAVSVDDDSYSRTGGAQAAARGGRVLVRPLGDAECKPRT